MQAHLIGRDERLRSFAAVAVTIEALHGIPAPMAVGQWAAESKWGFAPSGRHNFWGITFNPRLHQTYSWRETKEELTRQQLALWPDAEEKATVSRILDLPNGRLRVWMRRKFADFHSLRDGTEAYARLITRGASYAEAWGGFLVHGDMDRLIDEVGMKWATAKAYPRLVRTIAHQGNVQRALEDARNAPFRLEVLG
jgi:flagellum-specific peptidoglycan hydrolase FlgJ